MENLNNNIANNQIKGAAHQTACVKNEANRAAKAAIVKALQSANPHLVPVSEANHSRVAAAKNIRKELKKAFPSVKFSVTGESFAGGDAIRISWIDGATVAAVEAITNKYKAGSFDGMTDCYDYNVSAFNEAFGDAKFVSTSREYSLEARAQAIALVGAEYHDGELPTANDHKAGRLFYQTPSRHCDSWQDLVYRAMYQTAF